MPRNSNPLALPVIGLPSLGAARGPMADPG